MRLNAAVREYGLSYSKFIDKLNKNNISIDRKLLSDLAINSKESFAAIMKELA